VLPIGAEDGFLGIVDLIDMRAFVWNNSVTGEFETVPIPHELIDNAEIARLQMLENLAECDDEILECVLEEKNPSPDCIRAAIRKAVGECKFIPVLAGTALRNLAITATF
jgi:elongation factor G